MTEPSQVDGCPECGAAYNDDGDQWICNSYMNGNIFIQSWVCRQLAKVTGERDVASGRLLRARRAAEIAALISLSPAQDAAFKDMMDALDGNFAGAACQNCATLKAQLADRDSRLARAREAWSTICDSIHAHCHNTRVWDAVRGMKSALDGDQMDKEGGG